MAWNQCDECLDGSIWQRNDNGRKFVVVQAGRSYVYVENFDWPPRRRRIRRSALRTSGTKRGYTLVTGSPFAEATP